MFEKKFIEFNQTEILPSLIYDYLSGSEKLKEYYKYPPVLDSFSLAITCKQKEQVNRNLLADVLLRQYKPVFQDSFNANEIVKSNIEKLRDNNSFTVTTGHQLNIFTGPLYFLYKIISTINLSEKLKATYPENNFIPVYWMASEDHDFEEINHIHLFGKKIVWKNNEQGGCGRLNTVSLRGVIDELKVICGESINAKEIISLFEETYLGNKKLADATRYLVHRLFAKYGLVIVDGDDRDLKKEFTSVMKDDLFNHSAFKLIAETNKKLRASYKVQVNPREINLFYLRDGSRERIEIHNSQFTVHNSQLKFSTEQITDLLNKNSECFSPNVVLRPLYQEKILPNLAYIGGPGELSYWLQYKAMFDYYKINFPVLILRNSVLLLDKATASKMQKLNLSVSDLFADEQELVKKIVLENAQGSVSLADEIKEINELFEKIKQKTTITDQSLNNAVEAEKQRAMQQVKHLEEKLLRAEKKKHELTISRVKKIKEKLFPDNLIQERYDNFIPYYLSHGNIFLEELKKQIDPFDARLLVISEKNT